MELFIAADRPLPIVPWQKQHPTFNVQGLSDREQAVRKHFTKAHVFYYLAARIWTPPGCQTSD